MKNLPAIFSVSLLSLAALASCSSPASSNPVSEDGFVTIPGGTYVVGCDDQGNGCSDVTVETFEISQNPVSYEEWMECVNAGACRAPEYSSNISSEPVVGVSLDMAIQYAVWKSQLHLASYSIPSVIQLQISSHISESLSSDCRPDPDFITLSAKQLDEYRLPDSFSGTYDPKNLKICHSGNCEECVRYSRTNKRLNYFDSATRLKTPLYLNKHQ